ncbi:DUF4440 domain-containing protein [Exiguobacterium algae]|uniref:nuclear transport factor 2 family protein n=1 Tax=Exiguobacterium algae TaxID=2751250 RepID=UPI001BE8FC1E|nr:DUF4440 domain-containing protein [Exiguobacterium algae]
MNELSAHLQSLEEQLLTPEVRSSTEKLRTLLTEDFFEIGSSGRLLFQDWDAQTFQLPSIDATLSDFSIHPLSEEHVLVTYRILNHELDRETLRSSIWTKDEGRWKMRFHQGTVVPDEIRTTKQRKTEDF